LLASHIDKQIHQNYKLNPVNYIAYDIINQTNVFDSKYTEQEKNDFVLYVEKQTKGLKGESEILKNLFITLYANPVVNKLS